jgi:negative regulator of sigma E activity
VANDNPFNMSPEEIAMWLGGGALPGSVKHEQAKAALEWQPSQQLRNEASANRRWQKWGAIAGGIAAVAAVVAAVATFVG